MTLAATLAVFTGSVCSAALAEQKSGPEIQAVYGKGEVMIQSERGRVVAQPGAALSPGDRILTGTQNSATIRYADGSSVEVARQTEFKIEDLDHGTQWNRLKVGEVRATVTKQAAESKKPRFIIRTKSMTMGVRGTEFVMGINQSGLAQLHTLEGAVDVAPDELALVGGKGQSVSAGNAISADRTGLKPQSNFNTEAFKEQLKSNYYSPSAESTGGGAGGGPGTSPGGATGGGAGTAPPPTIPSGAGLSVPAPRIQAAPIPNVGAAAPPPAKPEQAPDAAKKEAGNDAKSRRIHILAAQVGGVYGIFKTNTSKNNPYIAPASGTAGTPDPNGGYFNSNGQTETYFTSFVFSYTPSVPVPFISFLYLRGQVSLLIFKDGFANDHFLVHELGGFVGTDLLKPIFIEAGGGHQFFRTQDLSHGFFAFYGGIILNADGFFNRVFVGRTELDGYPVRVEEYTAGLGIQL